MIGETPIHSPMIAPTTGLLGAAFSSDTETHRYFIEGQYENLWQDVSQKFDKTLTQRARNLRRDTCSCVAISAQASASCFTGNP